MASSTGPVRAGAAAMATTAAAASTAAAARGRSASPGQYTAHGIRTARAESHGQSGGPAGSTLAAWPETSGATGSMASPRTPRTGTVTGTEFRLNVVVGELQRQVDSERRTVHRQLQQLERRFQDHIATPAVARERWADLQGKVDGMLEEMSALARRVEGLDEKLRLRIGGCEETLRQRTQKLEQQLHEQEHKALLAASTNEEIQKRQAAKLRKVGQALEDSVRRMDTVEELARRPDIGTSSAAERHRALESRLAEHEQRYLLFEDEVRHHPIMSGAVKLQSTQAENGEPGSIARRGLAYDTNDDDEDPALRTLERDLAALAERHDKMLDEHGAELAKLRVRTDGQEQRLNSAADRVETAIAPLRSGILSELAQLREHDKQEIEGKVENLGRRVQTVTETSEEVAAEVRDRIRELGAEIAAAGLASRNAPPEHMPALQKLADAHVMHEQAIRRLEACVQEPQAAGVMSTEDLCSMLLRVESMENRVDCLEQSGGEQELSEKADRTQLLRVEAAVQELSEPINRLSKRTASNEARSAALERRVEQLQQFHANSESLGSSGGIEGVASSSPQPPQAIEELSAAVSRIDAVASLVNNLKARLLDLESVVESGTPLAASGQPSPAIAAAAVEEDIEELAERVAQSEEAMAAVKGALDQLQRKCAEMPSTPPEPNAAQIREDQHFQESMQRRVDQIEDSTRSIATQIAAATQAVDASQQRLGQMEQSQKGLRSDAESLKEKHSAHASAMKKLGDKFEASHADHNGRLVDLDGRLGALRGAQQKLEQATTAQSDGKAVGEDLVNSVSEALKRVVQNEERAEEAAAALQMQLEETIGSVNSRLDKLSLECSELLSGKNTSEDLAKFRAELEERLSEMTAKTERAFKDSTGVRSRLDEVSAQTESALAQTERALQDSIGVKDRLNEVTARAEQALRDSTSVRESSADMKQELSILRTSMGADFESRITEALARVESSDKVVAGLRSELQTEQASMKDLSKRVQEAVACVEASEAATKAVREELMGAASQSAAKEPEVPARSLSSRAPSAALQEPLPTVRGELSVRVIQGFNLVSTRPGNREVFVVVSVGSKEQETEVAQCPAVPGDAVWDAERFTFAIDSESPKDRLVTFSVYECNRSGSRRSLGWVKVDIIQSALTHGERKKGVIPLQKVLAGELEVELQFSIDAEEAVPADVIMFSGCKDSQTSADVSNTAAFGLSNEWPPGAGGACTCSMIKALEMDPKPSWIKLLQDMRDILKADRYEQIPQLSTSRQLKLNEPFNALGYKPSGTGIHRSVLVGINYVGSSHQLAGCHNDVKAIQRFLSGQGFSVYNQRVLMDDGIHERPTKANLMDAMAWLVDGAAPGDSLWFSYSGHGTLIRDTDGDERDGKDEAIVPVDYERVGMFRDDDLAQCLVAPLQAGVSLTCLMDCCHSGSVLDLPFTFHGPQAGGKGFAPRGLSASMMLKNHKFLASKFQHRRAPKALQDVKTTSKELSAGTNGSDPTLEEVEKLAAELSGKVAAELQDLAKHQEQLGLVKANASQANAGPAPSQEALHRLPEVEAGVAKLTEQVASELSHLKSQQSELTQVKMSMKGLSQVEEEVRDLGRQVAEELRGLRIHQEELVKAKVGLVAKDALAQAPSVAEVGDRQHSALEAQVRSFSQQMVAELEALELHQKELRGVKATVSDLSKQVIDNKKATDDLQKLLKLVGNTQKGSDEMKQILREWLRVAHGMANRGNRVGIGAGVGINAGEDSDDDDEISSYEQEDFEEDSMRSH